VQALRVRAHGQPVPKPVADAKDTAEPGPGIAKADRTDQPRQIGTKIAKGLQRRIIPVQRQRQEDGIGGQVTVDRLAGEHGRSLCAGRPEE
jgi:hypothetical protein